MVCDVDAANSGRIWRFDLRNAIGVVSRLASGAVRHIAASPQVTGRAGVPSVGRSRRRSAPPRYGAGSAYSSSIRSPKKKRPDAGRRPSRARRHRRPRGRRDDPPVRQLPSRRQLDDHVPLTRDLPAERDDPCRDGPGHRARLDVVLDAPIARAPHARRLAVRVRHCAGDGNRPTRPGASDGRRQSQHRRHDHRHEHDDRLTDVHPHGPARMFHLQGQLSPAASGDDTEV